MITSLDPADRRSVEANVAGVASLLVAKAFKIEDRLARPAPGRAADKDAGDVVRLMMTADMAVALRQFTMLLGHEAVGDITAEGLRLLRKQFGARRTPGTDMAADALAGGPLTETSVRDISAGFIDRLRALAV